MTQPKLTDHEEKGRNGSRVRTAGKVAGPYPHSATSQALPCCVLLSPLWTFFEWHNKALIAHNVAANQTIKTLDEQIIHTRIATFSTRTPTLIPFDTLMRADPEPVLECITRRFQIRHDRYTNCERGIIALI